MPEPEIRHLRGIPEFTQAVSFQEAVWGEGFSERVPKSLMKVAQRLGGVVAGAFDGDEMVGFIYGMTGIEDGQAVHWSDILAVLPGLRNGGLGRRLKLFQREACLERGVTRMYWTFDPLESRNGYLNLGKLGAVVREYVPDMYGASDSPLHRGLGTDRYVVTWELDSHRVERRLAGDPPPGLREVQELPLAFAVDGLDSELPIPELAEAPDAAPPVAEWNESGGVRVPIPWDIQALRDRDPALAASWRTATRAALAASIEAGFEVLELVPARPVSYYILRPTAPPAPEPTSPL